MFNLYKKLIIILLISIFQVGSSYACNKTEYGSLRAGYSYFFNDTFRNNTGNRVGINSVDVNYSEQYDYNNSPSFPNFSWTNWILNKNYILNSGESGQIVSSDTSYRVGYNPPVRSYNNLTLTYSTTYYEEQNGSWNGPFNHTLCKNYEITWCGDGIIDSSYSEICDPNDSNQINWGNAGCSSTCQPVNAPVIECGDGIINGTETCDYNDLSQTNWGSGGCSSICEPINNPINGICGADDGQNLTSTPVNLCNIGTSTSVVDNGVGSTYTWSCLGIDGGLTDFCSANHIGICGNGVIEAPETCDDGNTVNGDGCSSTCQIEVVPPVCGNGVIEAPETCDDGNTVNGDGCSSICQIEVVPPVCGNGVIEAGETCDDGNIISGDGCSNVCQIEGNLVNGLCGPDDGTTLSSFPTTNPLCNDGTPTAITGTGPWTWTCLGSNGGTDDVCNVNYSLVQTDGLCGPADGVAVAVAPINGLCTVGSVTPFPVAGTGPWTWTCPGINGGADVSCSAPLLGAAVCGNNIVEAGETCDDGNTVSGDGCSSICQTEGGGGGGGGGGTYECVSIGIGTSLDSLEQEYSTTAESTSLMVRCDGSNNNVGSFKIDCGNGQTIVGDALDSGISSYFIGQCDYVSDPSSYRPQCYISWRTGEVESEITDTSLSCRGNVLLGEVVGGVCGNGFLEGNEECERSEDGTWPNYCNSNCTFETVTFPFEGKVEIYPGDNSVVVGHDTNIFDALSLSKPSITSNLPDAVDFDALCIRKESNAISGGDINGFMCKSIGRLNPGAVVEFDYIPNFKGNKDGVPVGESFVDTNLITSIKHDNEFYDWAFFAKKIDVRVSKPSIVTIGGGVSFISSTDKISNITDVSDGFADTDTNKNFVGVGISTGSVSSYSKDITETEIVTDIGEDLNTFDTNLGTLTTEASITTFENYNGLDNVYILKGSNFNLENFDLDSVTEPTTYIIEDGSLIINNDITYSANNIAFVVRGGDIRIKSNVEEINGTYIAINKDGIGGNFIAEDGVTNNILNIKGSIYGNVEDLVNNRVYIEDTGDQINVGTIVSFGSSIFRQPAPLLSQFIEEYLASEKVAK